MTASEKPHRSLWRRAEGEPASGTADTGAESTLPRFPPAPRAEDDGPSLLGFDAEYIGETAVVAGPAEPAAVVAPPAVGLAPPAAADLVFSRRPEGPAGVLLVLAGIAGGISLVLPWTKGDTTTGSSSVHGALALLGDGAGALLRSSLWQPFAVVFGGYALLVVGLLLLVPARTHRALGVLAFLVAAPTAAGVVVPLADAGWSVERFGPGMWFAAAVGVLGLLGALKAMLTGPRIGLRASRPSAPEVTAR